MKDLKVKALFDQIVSALLLIIDRFGNDNLLHSKQVAVIAAALSEIVIPKKKDIIFYASLLHDVGAVIFGEHPAMFPSLEEQKRVPRIFEHPTISSKIISRIGGIKEVQLYIQDHHEWYNGNGYPNRKKGKNIPVGAQIIRIA